MSADHDAASAAELNRALRAAHEAPSPTTAPAPSALQSNAQYLVDHWTLSDEATVADWPRVGPWLARVAVLGGALAFARELYGALWQLAHRRAPLGQQIAFNRAVALAIQDLFDLDQITSQFDRELQTWQKTVAQLDDELLRLQRAPTEEALAAQVITLTARVETLTRVVDELQTHVRALQTKPSARDDHAG